MKFIDLWVHQNKTPIPLKEIIRGMKENGAKEFTTVNALNSLLRKGYLRRAVMISNQTFFVMLKRVV